jgi:hypothetical protein
LVAVDRFPQDRTRLESNDAPGLDGNRLTGLRIAAAAVVLLFHHEAAEAGDFEILALLQGGFDDGKHLLHHLGRFISGHTGTDLDLFNDVCFCHL